MTGAENALRTVIRRAKVTLMTGHQNCGPGGIQRERRLGQGLRSSGVCGEDAGSRYARIEDASFRGAKGDYGATIPWR